MMEIPHPSMLAARWDPVGMVEKARSLHGSELREWLETEAQWRVRDADEDVRPFVRLLQVMREDDRYESAGLRSWAELCAILKIKPDFAEQLEEGVRLLGWQGPISRMEACKAAAMATTGEVLSRGRPVALNAQFAHLDQQARAVKLGTSRRNQQKLDALARRRPDLLKAVKAGRMSTHAAAIEAGIVKATVTVPVDPEGAARVLRRRFTPTECSRLAALLIGD